LVPAEAFKKSDNGENQHSGRERFAGDSMGKSSGVTDGGQERSTS